MTEVSTVPAVIEFANHVQMGLDSKPKKLSSKYFYDDRGTRLFQEIMELPEYYLTNAENEILQTKSNDILETLACSSRFNLVELGAGDGAKTMHLLRALQRGHFDFNFIPIDISKQAIDDLEINLKKELPKVDIQSVVGDYFEVLENLVHDNHPNLLLFLGSNIGNFERPAAEEMFCKLQNILNGGDHVLVGFDLKKNPNTIRAAYFDARGVTKAFNLNLLHRINRELGANFDVGNFDFYSYYNPTSGEVRSFIISMVEQEVWIDKINRSFLLAKNEAIHTELSKKYSLDEIEELAQVSGFEIQKNFLDSRSYFADSLWKCIK